MKSLFFLLLSVVATGCTVTRYTHPQGGSFTRISVGTTQTIGPIEVTTPDGVTAKVEGYTSEQAQIAGTVVTAALKAAR